MNSIIKKQLEKVSSTTINFDDNTTNIFIPKTTRISNNSLKKGRTYIIELSDFTMNNRVLASNWNNGLYPKNKVYIVEVVDFMAKFMKVNGVAQNDSSDGLLGFWLPIDGFNVIKWEV